MSHPPRFSTEHIASRYAGGSAFDLWTLLTTFEGRHQLPSASWLFCRVIEWMSSTRSGVWQYYESSPVETQQAVSERLRQEPVLSELSEQFDFGMSHWRIHNALDDLDRWLDDNESKIHDLLMSLAGAERLLIEEMNEN